MRLNLEKKSDRNTGINKHFSIITLNVNGFNLPIKRHRLSDCIKKQDPTICCLEETHLTPKTHTTKSKKLEKDLLGMWKLKKAEVAILI
jgi:exonuclease III